jgi:hypothetical protein
VALVATLTLALTADGSIDRQAATTNYDTQGTQVNAVIIGGGKNQNRRAILRTILPAWLTSAQVTAAQLNMCCNPTSGGGAAARFYRIVSGSDPAYWVESQVTWNVRKTGTNWGTAGGDLDTTYGSWTLPATGYSGWIAITGLLTRVQDAIASRSDLFDLILMLENENPATTVAIAFGDRTHPTLFPTLQIEYAPSEVNFGQVI